MLTTSKIFLNDELQTQFAEKGFVKVDLLDQTEVNELIQYYKAHDQQPDEGGFYATMFHPDFPQKQAISKYICSIIDRNLKKYINGYRPLFGNYIVKAGRNTHEVGIHQDWTYVDERKYRSFNVWTSLSPSNDRNGGMYMLAGSHLVEMPIRWTPFDCDIYDRYREGIMGNSTGLDLQPGQAVIYDSAVIHYSSYNETDAMRIACGCVFVPDEATAMHYFRESEQLLIYEVDTDFFHQMKPGQKPVTDPARIEELEYVFDEPAFRNLLNVEAP